MITLGHRPLDSSGLIANQLVNFKLSFRPSEQRRDDGEEGIAPFENENKFQSLLTLCILHIPHLRSAWVSEGSIIQGLPCLHMVCRVDGIHQRPLLGRVSNAVKCGVDLLTVIKFSDLSNLSNSVSPKSYIRQLRQVLTVMSAMPRGERQPMSGIQHSPSYIGIASGIQSRLYG